MRPDYARDICVTSVWGIKEAGSRNAKTRSRSKCRTFGACNVGPETDIGSEGETRPYHDKSTAHNVESPSETRHPKLELGDRTRAKYQEQA
jgi:hypothetical protein